MRYGGGNRHSEYLGCGLLTNMRVRTEDAGQILPDRAAQKMLTPGSELPLSDSKESVVEMRQAWGKPQISTYEEQG